MNWLGLTTPALLPRDLPPLLLVVIDTEEEFDWGKPHSRSSREVRCIDNQHYAQSVLVDFGVVPTYVVDYPVASTGSSAAIFREWAAEGTCLVGAHLHPWVNPPDREEVSAVNSYPGNLDPGLEREKLAVLTAAIAENIGVRPVIYKAGRYGLGPNTATILDDLGYEIDLSVVPGTSFADDGGPDFRGASHDPFWFGPGGRLFEVPLTRGYPGLMNRWGESIHEAISGDLGNRLRLPGIFSRCGLLERIPLTPEGVGLEDNKRLVRHLVAVGRRIFTYAYHSSSLLPGGSPYTKSEAGREKFVAEIEGFLEFFTGEIGGRGTTPVELRDMCRRG